MATEIVLNPDKEYEIVDGRPQEKEMGGARHSGIGTRLIARLAPYVEAGGLGAVYGADATFKIGRNDRLPDVSFVAAARIPPAGEPEGPWPIAPDLAVEIISPNDLYEAVLGKVYEYLSAGVRQVWVISPEKQAVTIYKTPTEVVVLEAKDDLTGGDAVPGFRCPVAELFRIPSPR
jgi:Uma2 family endonuclease